MLTNEAAYDQARSEGVWLERPASLRLIRLTGPQRVWFLQNTITADVEEVPAGRWVESCFLDPKGRIQAHLRAGFLEEEAWLDVLPDAGTLAHWFESYKFRTKVEISAIERRSFSIVGAAADSWAGDGEINRHNGGIAFGYLLGDLAVADVHLEASPDAAVPEAPPELYEVLRVEAGVGMAGVDFGERDLPQEAGLTRVVPIDRGCYVGQETIARIHFRGHVNRALRPVTFDADDPKTLVGRELHLDGKVIGRVTSAVDSPSKGAIGLAMSRVEPAEGVRVEVEGGGIATLGPLPEGTKVKTG